MPSLGVGDAVAVCGEGMRLLNEGVRLGKALAPTLLRASEDAIAAAAAAAAALLLLLPCRAAGTAGMRPQHLR